MTEIMRIGSVVDITIEDPPLEEVIAHIYSTPAAESEEGDADEDDSDEGSAS